MSNTIWIIAIISILLYMPLAIINIITDNKLRKEIKEYKKLKEEENKK